MAERRDRERFDLEAKVSVVTTEFISNVVTEAYLTDCSREGVRIISPICFEPEQQIRFKIEMIGEPIEVEGTVLRCREDVREKFRFEKTYAIHMKFISSLSEMDWEGILALRR